MWEERGVSVNALKMRSAPQCLLRPYTNMRAGKELMVVIMRRLVESSRHVALGLVLRGVTGVISYEGSLVNTRHAVFWKAGHGHEPESPVQARITAVNDNWHQKFKFKK